MVDLGVSDLKACRVCLATNVKMYSLCSGYLNTCMHSLVGFDDSVKGLPQYTCYECTALLVKSYKLIERSNIVQAKLLDLYRRNVKITHSTIKKLDRTALNLKSFLQVERNVSETYEYVNDEEDDTPLIYIKSDPFRALKKEPAYEDEEQSKMQTECKVEAIDLGVDIEPTDGDFDMYSNDGNDVELNLHIVNDDLNDNSKESSHISEQIDKTFSEVSRAIAKGSKEILNIESEDLSRKRTKNKAKVVGTDGFTDDEWDLKKHFKIVKLTLEEQKEEFKKGQKPKNGDHVYECETCASVFTKTALLERHMAVHDARRGSAECPVCRHRYKNQNLVNAHCANTHENRFICNACPKVFKNMGMARRHHQEHLGLMYQCPHCAFTTAFEMSLGVHSRFMHSGCQCGRCKRTSVGDTRSKESNDKEKQIEDSSSSVKENRFKKCRKRKKPDKCNKNPQNPDTLTTCKLCGVTCPSVADLKTHRHKAHAGQHRSKKTWLMPGDCYPTQCEHCSTMLSCRKEHWAHVRRSHPDLKATYRSVITAVCEICGQGFQNTGRLRLHELRHGQPTVPCELCNKMFYDKFLLAIHMETHSEARPYRCHTCGKGFKTRSNLDKHHRTHSDVAAYTCKLCGKKFKYSTSMNLHIRTVHHKIPLPPRKRKSRKSAAENTQTQS